MRALIRRVVDHILGCRPKQVARRAAYRDEVIKQDPTTYWPLDEWPPEEPDNHKEN